LISTNDTTILAVLSRYPDIPTDEADEYISKIQHEENVPLCHAVIGRIEPDELNDEARITYDEFTRWSLDRTRRFRNEQIDARRRRKENRTAIKMTQLHEDGKISNEMMLMYGMSGALPERSVYTELSEEEKEAIWTERMERRFGPNWRRRFEGGRFALPEFLQRRVERFVHDWLKEGF